MKKINALNVLFGILLGLFIVSFSISVPINCRFIYYLCIGPMKIVETVNANTGLSYSFEDIVHVYNGVLNFCCFFTEWDSGGLIIPDYDIEHFADCRILFVLDFSVLIVSFIGLLVFKTIEIKQKINIIKPKTYLITAISLVSLLALIVIGGCIDFRTAFKIFHSVLFPGKSNWHFYTDVNHVIYIFPNEFFILCAIIIGVLIAGLCVACICLYFVKKKKLNKQISLLNKQQI